MSVEGPERSSGPSSAERDRASGAPAIRRPGASIIEGGVQVAEPVVVDLAHSPDTYRTRYRFPIGYMWVFPREAWAALREVMPWEALAVSFLLTAALWVKYGFDIAVSLGISTALALVSVQMLLSRHVVTATRIARRRGLFLVQREEIPLVAIIGGRVELPADGERFGDVVLFTASGERRLRAIHDPNGVLHKLLALRDSAASAGVVPG